MNKANLKSYAPQARKDFIAAVTARANQLGLSVKAGSLEVAPAQTQGDVTVIAGQAWPSIVNGQRDKLIGRIRKDGFEHTMEAVAYTWFNRFAALRYMELHDYLGHGHRALSSTAGGLPDILTHATDLSNDLPGLNAAKVTEFKLAGNRDGELYRMLLVAQCNALSRAMPFLFERIDDDSELLLPDNLLRSDSVIAKLVAEIPEEDWAEVEIIGWLYQFYISEKKDQVIGKVVNYNLIELGPKGTGKSHVYSEFSPHGILISGGEVTVPKLFVSNSSGKLGLVGYWDVVAFDEFAGKQKKVDKALVDIMKNYMANKSFSRGVETLGAEASMVFVGNTDHTVPYMLKHSDLFDPLPEKFHDSAFLDRVHSYIPGWEVDVIRGEMFSTGYGFVVDYLAEILKSLRSHDFSDRYKKHFSLSEEISTRDRDGINKTFSGLMKILYPQGEATESEIEDLLRAAIEGRKRVKDQLLRIDSTYPEVRFAYEGKDGQEKLVRTLEEDEYPNQYHRRLPIEGQSQTAESSPITATPTPAPTETASTPFVATISPPAAVEAVLKEQHLVFQENQRGVSFDALFGSYLAGAKRIIITDPYMRLFHQLRNLMDLMETISKFKGPDEEVAVHAVTVEDEFNGDRQSENLQKIADACQSVGIQFTWAYDTSGTKHDRDITTDHGWKIALSRGLDVFQRFELNDAFNFANRLQQHRQCKEFNVTYVRMSPGDAKS